MNQIDRIEDRVTDVLAGVLKVVQITLKASVDLAMVPVVLATSAVVELGFSAIHVAASGVGLIRQIAGEKRDEIADAVALIRG